jgi:hypothetical protein
MEDLYPHIWVYLRILLTTLFSVASGERIFPNSNSLKTYLRSSMSQETLSSLAALSIETAIAQNLDFSELVKNLQTTK